jgi:hypothetical protein
MQHFWEKIRLKFTFSGTIWMAGSRQPGSILQFKKCFRQKYGEKYGNFGLKIMLYYGQN